MKKTLALLIAVVMLLSLTPAALASQAFVATKEAVRANEPSFVETFNEGFDGWTLIDADEDGFNWSHSSDFNFEGIGLNGSNFMVSQSYDNGLDKALTPDNWMISPSFTVAENDSLCWNDLGVDADWAWENYSVYIVDKKDADSVSDFKNAEELFTGQSSGTWTNHFVPLTDYEGEEVTIAFRHHDITDMYILAIDEISVRPVESDKELNEALNVDDGELEFFNDTIYPWIVEKDGNEEIAVSGNIGIDASNSTIFTSFETEEDGMFFYFDARISSEEGFDGALLILDDETVLALTGEYDWEEYCFEVPNKGNHTVKFVYVKDVSDANGDDCVYVDNCRIGEAPELEDIEFVREETYMRTGDSRCIEVVPVPTIANLSEITYSSDDEEIAVVDEQGVIEALKEGEAIITAESEEGFTCELKVIVDDDISVLHAINVYSDVYNNGMYDIILESGEIVSVPTEVELTNVYAGAFIDEKNIFYYFSDSREFCAYNLNDGTVTVIVTDIPFAPIDATYDEESDKLFFTVAEESGSSALYYVSDLEEGEFKEVGVLSPEEEGEIVFGLAAYEGILYGIKSEGEESEGVLYTIDTKDADMTEIGSTEVYGVNFIQTMEFDSEGNLYWAFCGYNEDDYCPIYLVDTETGEAEVVIENTAMEISYMYFDDAEEIERPVESIEFSEDEITVITGDTYETQLIFTPRNATNKKVTYESSDEEIATVDENGIITGIEEGDVTITAITDDGDLEAVCEVTVVLGYEVTFVCDVNDEIIDTVFVEHGEDVETFPEPPVFDEWEFDKWDSDGENITEETTITALYKIIEEEVEVTGVEFEDNKVTLVMGDTYETEIEITPKDATNTQVTYKSSNKDVATVDENGVITGVEEGTATITVTTEDGEYTDTCEVTVVYGHKVTFICGANDEIIDTIYVEHGEDVKDFPDAPEIEDFEFDEWDSEGENIIEDTEIIALYTYTGTDPIEVTGVEFDEDKVTVLTGDTYKTKIIFTPNNATNKKVTYESSDEDVATVDEKGIITGIKEGKATITVTTDDGSYTDTCKVTVELGHKVTFICGVDDTIISIIYVEHGEDVEEFPRVPKVEGYEFDKWDSDGEEITKDTTITALYNKLGEVEVPVEGVEFKDDEITICTRETYEMVIEFTPENATNKKVTYTSSDEDIATVNDKGLVEGVKEGKAIITVKTEDGGFTAECEVTVILGHQVKFICGANDRVIEIIYVGDGKDVEKFPEAPEVEGYVFDKWDSDGKNITEDTEITALYTKNILELGDANGDGKVNTGDAVAILKYLVDAFTMTDEGKIAADYNKDGNINTGDAVAILKYIAGAN